MFHQSPRTEMLLKRRFSALAWFFSVVFLATPFQSFGAACQAFVDLNLIKGTTTRDLTAKGYDVRPLNGDFRFPDPQRKTWQDWLTTEATRRSLQPPQGFRPESDVILRDMKDRTFAFYYGVQPKSFGPTSERLTFKQIAQVPYCANFLKMRRAADYTRELTLKSLNWLKGDKSSKFKWGHLFIMAEERNRFLFGKGQIGTEDLDKTLKSYDSILKEAAQRIGSPQNSDLSKVSVAVRDVWASHGMTRYCRDEATMTSLAKQVCGNCVSQTLAILALMMDLDIKTPDEMFLGFEVFEDHVRPVLASQGLILDLVYAGISQTVRGQIFEAKMLIPLILRNLQMPLSATDWGQATELFKISAYRQIAPLEKYRLPIATELKREVLSTGRWEMVNLDGLGSSAVFNPDGAPKTADLNFSSDWQIMSDDQGVTGTGGTYRRGDGPRAEDVGFWNSVYLSPAMAKAILPDTDPQIMRPVVEEIIRLGKISPSRLSQLDRRKAVSELGLRCDFGPSPIVFISKDILTSGLFSELQTSDLDLVYKFPDQKTGIDFSSNFLPQSPDMGWKKTLRFVQESDMTHFRNLSFWDQRRWLLKQLTEIDIANEKQFAKIQPYLVPGKYFSLILNKTLSGELEKLRTGMMAQWLIIDRIGVRECDFSEYTRRTQGFIRPLLTAYARLRQFGQEQPRQWVAMANTQRAELKPSLRFDQQIIGSSLAFLKKDPALQSELCELTFRGPRELCMKDTKLVGAMLNNFFSPFLRNILFDRDNQYTFQTPKVVKSAANAQQVNLPEAAPANFCAGKSGLIPMGAIWVDCAQKDAAERLTKPLAPWIISIFEESFNYDITYTPTARLAYWAMFDRNSQPARELAAQLHELVRSLHSGLGNSEGSVVRPNHHRMRATRVRGKGFRKLAEPGSETGTNPRAMGSVDRIQRALSKLESGTPKSVSGYKFKNHDLWE